MRWLATVEGVTSTASASVGQLLREWRARRRLSQLDLSIQADISARHLSFVETGRSRPTRRMILRLSEHLDVPLRERNQLLLAGGYAPAYPQHGLDEPQIGAVRDALKQVLRSHEPSPAVVINRWWDMVDGNRAIGLFVADCAPELLEPPVNVLRLTLHPDGVAPRIVNLSQWRAHLLQQLHQRAAQTGDARYMSSRRSYAATRVAITTSPWHPPMSYCRSSCATKERNCRYSVSRLMSAPPTTSPWTR